MLLFLFGFVDEKGERVGEVENHEQRLHEASKNAIKRVKLVLPEVWPVSSSTSSPVAKQVVRMAMLEMVGALGQVVDTDEPNSALSLGDEKQTRGFMQLLAWLCFSGVVLAVVAIVVFMVVDTSASESEEDPGSRRRRYLFSSLDEVSDPEEWMVLNHHDYSISSQEAEPEVEVDAAGPRVGTPLQYGMFPAASACDGNRPFYARPWICSAILYNLLRILRNYERNGITTGEADHMTLMHRSIGEMESVLLERGGSILAIQDEGQERIYQNFADNLSLEPDMEEPSAEEIAGRGMRLWQDAIPDADQPGPRESMAMWMIRRLTRRIVMSCVGGRPAMCRYMAMRETLRNVLRACARSYYNRSRAMVMMHEVTDLSEHSSSVDDAPQDPFHYMFTGIPDGEHLYEQIFLDDDDHEVNARRAHGPLDERGLVDRSATIPPYVTINDRRYYTAASSL